MKWNDTISSNEFNNHLNTAMQPHKNFKIRITDKEPIGSGRTYDHFGEIDSIIIGIKQINTENKLTYGDLTTTLITLYHEVGHARQVKYEFKEKTDLSTILALNHYARKCSLAYYDVDRFDNGNYPTHTTEIAAQYFGLRMTHAYLEQSFDSKTANNLICDHVNNEICANFIPVDKNNPYISVDDIFKKYNDKFNEMVYQHRDFNTTIKHEPDVYDTFENNIVTNIHLASPSTPGLQQDAILTNIYCKYSTEKEYLTDLGIHKGIIKAFDNIEFDKMRNIITGKKHIPAVQRVNLDELLPKYETKKKNNDYDFN